MNTNPNGLTCKEVVDIAKQAYTYGYPLMMMDTTKRVQTNVVSPKKGHAPINQVGKAQTFPTYETTDVVKPNVDTLYNIVWYDLSDGPMVLSVPYTDQYIYNNGGTGPRYAVFPFLDAYSNVFNSSGTRITESEPLLLFVYGPDYKGDIPANMDGVAAPTNMVWMLGRIQANGQEDGENFVWPIQRQILSIPYSKWLDSDYVVPEGKFDPLYEGVEPVSSVLAIPTTLYFDTMLELMDQNPPPSEDQAIVDSMASIGMIPGQQFDIDSFDIETQEALRVIPNHIVGEWAIEMNKKIKAADENVNNWVNILQDIGTYGTDYLQRAFIAYKGLGANIIEDAMYPNCQQDETGALLEGGNKYKMTFDKEPPVGAFWSVTCYNADNFLVENPIDKYCVGSIDGIQKRNDGSFDILIQNTEPESGKANWLPSPSSGNMSLTMRLYLPDDAALTGDWQPPAVILNN